MEFEEIDIIGSHPCQAAFDLMRHMVAPESVALVAFVADGVAHFCGDHGAIPPPFECFAKDRFGDSAG